MADEFKVIETQEQFDEMIKSRLEKAKASVRSEFADYDSIKLDLANATKEKEELNGRISAFETQVAELTAKLAKSETDSAKTRIAREEGLPFEMVSRLTGTSEDEIRADAKELAKLFKKTPPQYKPEKGGGDSKEAAFREMLSKMKE